MNTQPQEVRQCPNCQQPEVVLVMDWQHTTFGVSTSETTREYRCQACGAWAVRKPRSRVIAYWILGVLLSIPCLMGVPFLFLAWRQHTFEARVALVPGAPVPALRFPGGPPLRTCAKCNGAAKAVRITRHTHNGVPTGTDHEYECAGCGLNFTTENVLAHVVGALSGALVLGISAAFFLVAHHPGWRFGGGGVALLGALLLFWQGAERLLNRFRHAPRPTIVA